MGRSFFLFSLEHNSGVVFIVLLTKVKWTVQERDRTLLLDAVKGGHSKYSKIIATCSPDTQKRKQAHWNEDLQCMWHCKALRISTNVTDLLWWMWTESPNLSSVCFCLQLKSTNQTTRKTNSLSESTNGAALCKNYGNVKKSSSTYLE